MASSTRAALLWSFAERYVGVAVSIASTMVLSRLLTPAQVGIYSLCAAVTAVAGIVRDFGVSEYLIQERDLTVDKLRSAGTIAYAAAWGVGAAIWLARDAVAAYYAEPLVAEVLLVLVWHVLLLPVTSPAFALLNRELAFRQIFHLQVVCNTAQAAASVGMAWAGMGVMSLAWGPVVNVAVQTVILAWMRPRDCLRWPGAAQLRAVLGFGLTFMSSRTLEVLSRNVHEPVIAKQFDFGAVGLFSRAFGLIDLFHQNIGAAVVRVTTPAFAAGHREGDAMAGRYARMTAIYVSVSWTFFGLIAILADPIILAMFGPQWSGAAPLVRILAVSAVPYGLYALAPQMLSATGHVGRRLRITLWVFPVHVLGVFVASRFGLAAVAWVWTLSGLITLGLCLHHVGQVFAEPVAALLRPSLSSAFVAGGSVLASALVATAVGPGTTGPLLHVVLVSGCCVAAWMLLAALLRHPAWIEGMAIIHAVRARRRGESKAGMR